MRWYAQAGTPEVSFEDAFDAQARRYTLTLRQHTPPTPGQAEKHPLPIPVALGLLAPDGSELLSRTVLLRQSEQAFVFDDVAVRPVPSLLRGFSAPVKLRGGTEQHWRFLARHDGDPFVRWDAIQHYATGLLLELARRWRAREELALETGLSESIAGVLGHAEADPAFAAIAMALPSEARVGDEMPQDDVEAVHAVRRFATAAIGRTLSRELRDTYDRLSENANPAAIDGLSIGRRSLKNICLWYLAQSDPGAAAASALRQFEAAVNMTDVLAALGVLSDIETPERDRALASFHARWRDDALVLDKWFAIQAGSAHPGVLQHVLRLSNHPDFDLGNPNRVRALIGTFAANRAGFHAAGGEGYRLLADTVIALDKRNSQVAARLTTPLARWRRFAPERQARMQAQLRRIHDAPGLSRATGEMVSRSLAD
ncbi:MAG: DUF3458 domain-containing protein [Acetobacteraceae bacterium]|nr:DUF3458 domain-containing protein [Acetobacteraceae bacterium]